MVQEGGREGGTGRMERGWDRKDGERVGQEGWREGGTGRMERGWDRKEGERVGQEGGKTPH